MVEGLGIRGIRILITLGGMLEDLQRKEQRPM
jgi:hypothetical protein